MDDDDDRFLYGDSNDVEEAPKPAVTTSVPQPIPLEQVEAFASSNGVVAHLEAKAADETNGPEEPEGDGEVAEGGENEEGGGEAEGDEEEEEEEDEDSEDDVEIIMELPQRSLDFRNRPQSGRPPQPLSTPTRPAQAPAPTLTTEYTPRERGSTAKLPVPPPTPGGTQPSPSTPVPGTSSEQKPSDGVDPATLPVATAPPSHPQIDPDAPGIFDGRSILEIDLSALTDKGWRRPGSDISDWFNYGFDETSWEAYCHRRRDMGELANVLKTNVLNFAGMPEEQLNTLPPELRTMVIASASAMMGPGNGAPGPGGMMPGGMNMNGGMMNPMMNMGPMMGPMMEMGGVDMGMGGQGMPMGMGPGMGDQGMGMGGPGMGGQGMGGQGMGGQGMGAQGMGGQGMGGPGMGGPNMGGPGMGGQGMGGQGMGGQGMGGQGMGGQGMGPQGMGPQGMGGPGMGGPNMNGGALSGGVAMSSGGQGPMQGRATPDVQQMNMEGFPGNAPGQGQMGMGGDFSMQQPDMNASMGQQVYSGGESGGSGTPVAATTPTRGGTPGHFARGRGMPQNAGLRGARGGAYASRGRALPVRPASPLPPNVPTGPRNKNKYKDIDGSAPAVDGLDYGGGVKERTTPPDHDDRSSRKRRSSPGLDDGRGSKRR